MPFLVAPGRDVDAEIGGRRVFGKRAGGLEGVDDAERAVEPAGMVLALQMRAGEHAWGRTRGSMPNMLPMPSILASSPASVRRSANQCRASTSSREKVGRWTPVL